VDRVAIGGRRGAAKNAMLSLDDVGKGNEAQPADINRRIEGGKIGGVVAVAIGK